MLSLVTRRLIRLVVVLAGVSLVTFAILQVSGDPVSLMMPEAPEADRVVLRLSMGFNDPLPVQFARFLGNIVRGDFGQSFFHREPALPIVLARMPTTLLLTLVAMALSLAIAMPIGIVSAVRRNSAFDHTATLIVFLAAQRVMSSRLPITLVPLDATNQVRVTADFAARFKQRTATPAGRFVDAVLDRNDWFIASGEYYFWDVLAAIVAVEPQYCSGVTRAVAVAARPAASAYAAGEDASLPATRWDGHARRHLDAATAGRARFASHGIKHLVCNKTDAAAVTERFTEVLNGAP